MSFDVGPIRVDPPVLLAPMEDVSNLPFRLIAKEIANPGLMFTEFVSAMAVHYGARKTFKKLTIHARERPLGIQIFGGDPEIMAETARHCEVAGADIVDINMGCWVPKVCRTGSGAALLKDPDHAERIVRAVVNAVRIPVTVKVRAGWDYSSFAAPELARRFQDCGVKMLTLHARFAKQGFDGEADWRLISELRKAIQIPLIGNGDIKTPADARRMMSETGCDGIMVGRAAISNPWALAAITSAFSGIASPTEPSIEERLETAMRHLKLMVQYEAGHFAADAPESVDPEVELRACRALRGQIPLYLKSFPGAAALRTRLHACNSVADYQSIFDSVLELDSQQCIGVE